MYYLLPYLLNVVYACLLAVVWPWLLYQAVTKRKYREGFAEKFLGSVPERSGDAPCLWLHAVSVGEVNLLATLLKEFRRRHPAWQCVISTTTMTGMALARKKHRDLLSFYCPLDFSWAVRRAMRRMRPDVLALAELEVWPNLVRAAGEHGARVAIFNGRLSEKSFRGYLRIAPLVRTTLARVDMVASQNREYAERFVALGARPHTVHVTGSMKFDGAQTDRRNEQTRRLAALAGITPDEIVFLAGSTQEPEEQLAIEAFKQLAPRHPRLRLIIVPRHPERFDSVAALLVASGLPWQRRSRMGNSESGMGNGTALFPIPHSSFPIILVDAVGELGAWWGTAAIAFVGGSLGRRGGQNMIEPAAYGAAVAFGPNTWNFRDIVAALLEHQAAVVVYDGAELTAFVERCLAQPDFAQTLGMRAREFVATQLGATARTVDQLEPLLALRADAARRRAA
ncbi:MAG TPA: 3-deoxy-D-manno-octulosonic acid transferase [Pirellulales bacterium]|jgi:3-deoxy-D-manno-octulosonic-acid transferase|nr:3-deoxy-D-manno-octulosonic acid transferase [Pirellulales bacterium]